MRKSTRALGVVVLTLACFGCSSSGGNDSGTTATAETYPSSFPVAGTVLPNGGNNGDSAVWYKVSGLASGSSYQVAVAATVASKYTLNVQSSMSAVDDLCVASPATAAATTAQCSFKATAGTIYVGVANLDTQTIKFTLSVAAQ